MATLSGSVDDDRRYGQNHRLGHCAIAPQYVVDQKTVYATIAVGQRMNVDKAKSGYRAAHDRRLPLCALKEFAQAFQHGRSEERRGGKAGGSTCRYRGAT